MDELFAFLDEMAQLKMTKRRVLLPNGDQESTAEHTWRMAVMGLLIGPQLEHKVDTEKTVRLILAHDIIEAYVGDMAAFDYEARDTHRAVELEAFENVCGKYSDAEIQEFLELWKEYEEGSSPEAKFAKALDKLEVAMQVQAEDINTWEDVQFAHNMYYADKFCAHDKFLRDMNEHVKQKFREKVEKETDKNMNDILQHAEALRAKHG